MSVTQQELIDMFGEKPSTQEEPPPIAPVDAIAPTAPDVPDAPIAEAPQEVQDIQTSEDLINAFGEEEGTGVKAAAPPPNPEDQPGYVSNLGRKLYESGYSMAGEMLGTAEAVSKGLENTPLSLGDEADSGIQALFKIASIAFKSVDAGARDISTPETVKAEFREGDVLGTIGEALSFSTETLVQSIPYMISLPATFSALTNRIATENAKNQGKAEPDVWDHVKAAPFALGSAILERFGAKGIVKAGKKSAEAAARKTGEKAIEYGLKQVVKAGIKASTKESGTEFFQEGVIEYIGERYGTDAKLDWKEGAERGGWAALAGGTYGAVGGLASGKIEQGRQRKLAGVKEADDLTDAIAEAEKGQGDIDQAQADAVDAAQEAGGDELDQALAGAQGAAEVAARQGDEVAAVEEATALQESIAASEKDSAAEQAKRELEAAKTSKKQQAQKREDESVEEFRARMAAAGVEAGETTAQPVKEPQTPVAGGGPNPAIREALKKAETERIAKEKEEKAKQPAPVEEPTGDKKGEYPEGYIAQESVEQRRTEDRPGKDRREDTKQRKAINEMTLEEAQHELRTDELTGLGSRRAWEETEKKPVIAAIDADSLKWFNTNMSERAGDDMLKEIGKAIAAETDGGFHPTGDEFFVQGDTQEEVDAIMARVEARLTDVAITTTRPDGTKVTKTGVSFSYGLGGDVDSANLAMHAKKAEREKSGERVATGERPAGVSEVGFNAYREEEIKQEEKKKAAKKAKKNAAPKSEEELAAEIREEADKAATSPTNNLKEPTEAQKATGKYKKGHPVVQGVKIAVENPVGSVRTGTNEAGKKWEQELQDDYGYVKNTVGADGDPVDAFIGTNPKSEKVYVVDQVNQDNGEFDEHKVMIGYTNGLDAKRAYSRNYEAGWKVGPITEMTMDQFKQWIKSGDTERAFQLEKIQTAKKNAEANLTEQEIADTIASQTGKGRRTTVTNTTTPTTKESSRLKKAKTRLPVSTEEDVETILGEPSKRTKTKPAKAEPKVSVQQVNELADTVKTEMPSVNITVVSNAGELPANLYEKLKNDKATGAKGFYDPVTDQIYILSDNASSVADVEATLLHEVVAHKGLRALLGDNFDTAMDELYRSITDRKALNALAEKNGIDTKTDEGRRLAAEEYAASIAEKDTGTPGIQRLIAKVRAALRKMGVISEWTNDDIKSLLAEARRGMQRTPLSEIMISTQIEVEETGDIVKIEESADIEMRQLDKRRGIIEQLRDCLG